MFNFSVSERNKLNQQSLTKEDVATQILNEHWCVNIKDFRFIKHLCVNNYIVCLTGEIDNLTTLAVKHHINVRDPLSACLLLFQKVGIEIFEQLSGAFSLIILTPNRQAYAVRDRFGIYPLYFTTNPFRISDDLESFNNFSVSHNAIRLYTCLQYVPEPLTIYDKVFAVTPGHLLKYDGQIVTSSLLLSSSLIPQPVIQISKNKQLLHTALFESVEKALNHDLNSGVYLSGGIDSSILTAIASKIRTDVKAYTVGFEAPNFHGEVQDARRFADFLKIELIEKTYTFNDFADAFYPTIKALSTPLADPCAVAVFLLAKMASKQTNTILSGEGADELFCGYKPYSTTVWSRRFGNTHNFVNNLLYPLSKLFPKNSLFRNLVRNQFFPLYGHYFGPTSLMTDYEHRQYLSTFCEKGFVKAQMGKYLISNYSHSRLQQMQMFDFKTWLVSDILCVANRLNRVHGISLHLPYLSDSVFNIAKNCRDEEKISECQNKIILRKTFSDLLPDSLVNKPKAGFPVPVSIWIKNELYSWAFEILSSDEAKVVLHSQNAIELLKNYSQGNAPQHYFRYLWLMICLVEWFKANDNTSHKA